MANILNLITIGEKKYLIVDADPSAATGTPAELGSIAIYENGTTSNAYLKNSALDTGWDPINTAGASGTVSAGVAGRLALYPTSSNNVDDIYVQNSQNIDVQVAAQPTRSAPIQYNIPNPGDAIASADFVLTEGAQTINGIKTFQDDLIVNGDLTVNGTLTYLNTTNTQVSDSLLTLNKGGPAGSAGGSGIEVEEASVITAYVKQTTSRDGWELLTSANSANPASILLSSLTADRSYTLPDFTGTFVLGTAAAGQVGYWTSANVQSGSNNLFWDIANNRLGIKTAAPSTELHVVGGARITGIGSANPVKVDSSGVLYSGTIGLATSEVSGVLPIANGGTNSSTALNNNRIMVSSAGAIVEAAALTNGQLLIGSTGAAPVAANLSQGAFASVTITNGAGSITLDTVQDIRTSASPSFVNVTLSGKTPGSVLFAGSGGVVAQDNTNLFFDDTNNRLGIGTATPVRPLDVNGSSILRGAIRFADAAATSANLEMFQSQVNTTDATITTAASITVPTDSALYIEATIIGRRTGGTAGANGDAAIYVRTARVKNVAGTVTILNLQSDYTSEDQGAWNGTIDVSGTSARVRVTGAANNNITWTVNYKVSTVS